jgi:hypothetical protein
MTTYEADDAVVPSVHETLDSSGCYESRQYFNGLCRNQQVVDGLPMLEFPRLALRDSADRQEGCYEIDLQAALGALEFTCSSWRVQLGRTASDISVSASPSALLGSLANQAELHGRVVYSPTQPAETYDWPLDYGNTCDDWDKTLQPDCADADGTPLVNAPYWCASTWCYVDVNNCDASPLESVSFPGAVNVWWSIATCPAGGDAGGTAGCPCTSNANVVGGPGMLETGESAVLQYTSPAYSDCGVDRDCYIGSAGQFGRLELLPMTTLDLNMDTSLCMGGEFDDDNCLFKTGSALRLMGAGIEVEYNNSAPLPDVNVGAADVLRFSGLGNKTIAGALTIGSTASLEAAGGRVAIDGTITTAAESKLTVFDGELAFGGTGGSRRVEGQLTVLGGNVVFDSLTTVMATPIKTAPGAGQVKVSAGATLRLESTKRNIIDGGGLVNQGMLEVQAGDSICSVLSSTGAEASVRVAAGANLQVGVSEAAVGCPDVLAGTGGASNIGGFGLQNDGALVVEGAVSLTFDASYNSIASSASLEIRDRAVTTFARSTSPHVIGSPTLILSCGGCLHFAAGATISQPITGDGSGSIMVDAGATLSLGGATVEAHMNVTAGGVVSPASPGEEYCLPYCSSWTTAELASAPPQSRPGMASVGTVAIQGDVSFTSGGSYGVDVATVSLSTSDGVHGADKLTVRKGRVFVDGGKLAVRADAFLTMQAERWARNFSIVTADLAYGGVVGQFDDGSCTDLTMNDGSVWNDGVGYGCTERGAGVRVSCGPYGLTDQPKADEACCACGGGGKPSRSTLASTCTDITLHDGSPWDDGTGYGCTEYGAGEGVSCGPFGGEGGYNAEEACCACGGGVAVEHTARETGDPPFRVYYITKNDHDRAQQAGWQAGWFPLHPDRVERQAAAVDPAADDVGVPDCITREVCEASIVGPFRNASDIEWCDFTSAAAGSYPSCYKLCNEADQAAITAFTKKCTTVVQVVLEVRPALMDESATSSPTAFPTLYPTPEATNPERPPFDEVDFNIDFLAVNPTWSMATMVPTAAPTAFPTLEGYYMEATDKEVSVVSTTLSFPFSAEEAMHPVVQASLETGMAASLGLSADKVSVSITARRRRLTRSRFLVDSAAFDFAIESASGDPSEVEKLKNSVRGAASEGSIVAHVQQAAFERGVLTQALKDFERGISDLQLTDSNKVVTVYAPVRGLPDLVEGPDTGAVVSGPAPAPVAPVDADGNWFFQDADGNVYWWFWLAICGIVFVVGICCFQRQQQQKKKRKWEFTETTKRGSFGEIQTVGAQKQNRGMGGASSRSQVPSKQNGVDGAGGVEAANQVWQNGLAERGHGFDTQLKQQQSERQQMEGAGRGVLTPGTASQLVLGTAGQATGQAPKPQPERQPSWHESILGAVGLGGGESIASTADASSCDGSVNSEQQSRHRLPERTPSWHDSMLGMLGYPVEEDGVLPAQQRDVPGPPVPRSQQLQQQYPDPSRQQPVVNPFDSPRNNPMAPGSVHAPELYENVQAHSESYVETQHTMVDGKRVKHKHAHHHHHHHYHGEPGQDHIDHPHEHHHADDAESRDGSFSSYSGSETASVYSDDSEDPMMASNPAIRALRGGDHANRSPNATIFEEDRSNQVSKKKPGKVIV